MTDQFCSAEVEVIAKKAAEQAVEGVLQKLGVDVTDPREMQQDMLHLRQQRVASEKVTVTIKRTFIGVLISSGLAVLWLGFKHAINS